MGAALIEQLTNIDLLGGIAKVEYLERVLPLPCDSQAVVLVLAQPAVNLAVWGHTLF